MRRRPPAAMPSPNHSLNVHKQVSSLAVGGWCMTNVIPESNESPFHLSPLAFHSFCRDARDC
jgi:hypothetical protein